MHLREIATFFGAQDYDSHSRVVKGGVASDDEDHARFAEEIGETITVEEFDHKLH